LPFSPEFSDTGLYTSERAGCYFDTGSFKPKACRASDQQLAQTEVPAFDIEYRRKMVSEGHRQSGSRTIAARRTTFGIDGGGRPCAGSDNWSPGILPSRSPLRMSSPTRSSFSSRGKIFESGNRRFRHMAGIPGPSSAAAADQKTTSAAVADAIPEARSRQFSIGFIDSAALRPSGALAAPRGRLLTQHGKKNVLLAVDHEIAAVGASHFHSAQ